MYKVWLVRIDLATSLMRLETSATKPFFLADDFTMQYHIKIYVHLSS